MFHLHVNIQDTANQIGKAADIIKNDVLTGVEQISIGARDFIIYTVQESYKAHDYYRTSYLGNPQNEAPNIKWSKLGDGMWQVEVDEKARWLEEGRASMFMEWLLKNAKTAKDGCVLNPRNKVLTTKGWIKIKNIKAGDMVLTHSGKFREVKELLIQKTEIGTKFVNFYVKYDTTTGLMNNLPFKNCNEITSPSISLTSDHLVLTPNGWVEAGTLRKGDLVAAPADLKRLCKWCGNPLPINTPKREFCLNNSCARSYSTKIEKKGLGTLSDQQRKINARIGNEKAKEMGIFNSDTWGCRDPKILQKMRLGSNEARKKWGNGTEPELFLEKKLIEASIAHLREVPIKTDEIVNAGSGRLRHSTLFIDFVIPELNLAIEVDGRYWHEQEIQKARDERKNAALERDGMTLWRIPAKDIYSTADKIIEDILRWKKNHSGELGICWVPITKLKCGVVNRPDHCYANKYDICLEAEEHSFACQTIFIHNSKYKVIPMSILKGAGKQPGWKPHNMPLADLASKVLKDEGINLKKLDRDIDKKPLVYSKLIDTSGYAETADRSLFSMPRDAETAKRIGLKPHSGIFMLEGLRVNQTPNLSAKHGVSKEAMTFRVISSKHQAEGRWFYPEIKALNAVGQAEEWARQQMKLLEDSIKQKFENNT